MATGSQNLTTYISNTLAPRINNISLSNFIDGSKLIYTYYGGSNSVGDKPPNVDAFGVMSFKTASGWYGQLLMSSNTATGIYWRTATSLSGGWRKLLDSSNYTDYTVTKTGDGASGTWGISITGKAGSVDWANTGHPSTFPPSSHIHYELATIGDKRNENTTPDTYINRLIFQGLKTNTEINSPYTDSYSYLIGLRGWSDSSGGDSHELAFNGNGIYRRQGATTTWGNWFHILDSNNYTLYTVTKTGSGASGTWGINVTGKSRYVEGDDDAANPGGALLRSGSGRADASPSGDTWIYWDTLGGTSSYWGIRHDQGANTISFCGAGGVGAYITLNTGNSKFGTISSGAISSSSSVTCTQILVPTTVDSAATSQPTALSYGRLQAYGTLCINANTDNSGTEYVILTAGHGCSSSISDGFYVGTSEVGSYLSTRIRNTLHIHPPNGSWVEGIRIHAAASGWATLILCGTDNTGDSGTSANSYSMHAYRGNFYLARNGSSSGSSLFSCLTDNYWRISTRLYGAVWNDFAEYRRGETIEGGRAVYDDNTGIMKITTERMQPASRLVSDTYGFAVGESDDAHTPIGVGGRVLAYPYQDRNNYKVGDAVCAAPNGTVDIMTREEIKEYPDRIIGIVSEVPDYEIWENKLTTGGGMANVPVNGRIWVYVR